jgi:hypothetical protein
MRRHALCRGDLRTVSLAVAEGEGMHREALAARIGQQGGGVEAATEQEDGALP